MYNVPFTHVVIIILDGLSGEVEHSTRHDMLADKVTDLKVRCQDGLRVLILNQIQTELVVYHIVH